MTDSALDEARTGRTRIAAQLRQIQGRRPTTAAGPDARASWLRDKAGVHDQIAGYLRQIGDVAGAVEAEVLAARCRADAHDLAANSAVDAGPGEAATALGPCPGWTCTEGRASAHPYGCCHVDAPPTQRTDQNDVAQDVTCGPGLP